MTRVGDRLARDGGEPVRSRPFPSRSLYGEEAERLVLTALRSQNLFGMGGRMHDALEGELATFYGADHAIACSSGTAAVHVALAALDLEPGSEVITAPITDAGTVAPILFQQCVPVFSDVDRHYCMDPDDIERRITDRTAAILVVHLFGAGCDMRRIAELARSRGLALIEDCSQSHAVKLDDRWLGRWGHIAAFSMQQSKFMTTGDGGFVLTDNDAYARRMRAFRDKGWFRGEPGSRHYAILGLNYRLTELQAAVGLSQLPGLRQLVLRRQQLGGQLAELIQRVDGVSPQVPTPGSEHGYWQFPFEIDTGRWRPQTFAEALRAEGVPTGVGYTGDPIYICMRALADRRTFGSSGLPLTLENARPPAYGPGLCPRTEALLGRLLTLSINEGFDETDIEDMALAVEKVARLLPSRTPDRDQEEPEAAGEHRV